LQLGIIGKFTEQLALVAVAFDRTAVLHATLIFFLLLARFGAGKVRAIEVTSHFLSP
jgi:hypothetical protein